MRKNNCLSCRGFSLLELVLVMTIVGVLSSVAYPAYLDSIRATRRVDAMNALLTIQQMQAKYRSNHVDFGTLVDIGFRAAGASGAVTTDGEYYTLALSEVGAVGYTITATAVKDLGQSLDKAGDTHCGTLTITVAAQSPRGMQTPAGCWQK